jgi:tetratricopeptide (TPR) repeat protein
VYKPVLAIFFVIIIVFGVAIFSISYKLGNSSFIKLLSGKGFTPYNKGIYTETMTYFDTALAIELNDSDALNDKGNDLSDLGHHTEAIKYYDKALTIEPDHVNSLYNKGNSLNTLGNYTEAIEYYDRVLAIEPNHADALNNKGNIFRKLGNYTEAIEYFDKALAIEPNHILALTNKGVTLDVLGKPNEAITYFDKALAIEPNSTYTLNNKGNSLYRLGNHTEAIEYYDRVLAIEPNHADALSKKRLILNLMQASSDFLTYQHPDLGFTVEYPSNTEVEEEHADGVVFLIQEGSVLINIRQLSEKQTLEQFTDERRISLQEYFKNVEFPVETIPTILVGGYPADQIIFGFDSYDSPGERMLGILVTSVVNGTIAVQLLFAGNAEQPLNVFLHMKNTFDVSGSQQEIQSNDTSNRILSQQNVTEAATNITEEISQLFSAELSSLENFSISELNFDTYENQQYGITMRYPENVNRI